MRTVGSVVSWGEDGNGGHSGAVQDQLKGCSHMSAVWDLSLKLLPADLAPPFQRCEATIRRSPLCLKSV